MLRVIDELPDQLYQMLEKDKELSFLAVPEPRRQQLINAGYITIDEEGQETHVSHPTVQQWAKYLGLSTNFEVPEDYDGSKHDDTAIQTLHFPSEMEGKLRSIRTKANSLIEESGANALYLAFGFLEWYESEDSKQTRSAPLFLVPVQLVKGRLNKQLGTYEYRLKASGAEIISNLSLKEKLRIDFGMALPDLEEDDTPEEYFKKVQDILHSHPSWKIKRFITLSLFNFSKLLMFLDLDPQRWPNESIADNELVKQFFEGVDQQDSGTGGGFLGEHTIDAIPDIHSNFPLIDDADSSQHSALIDAIEGKNLVIEGPPGSGKSQTITNLIAAAMQQGKKVLFVAEKLAALEVVRRKLDNAGLGDFCLELHSHKSQKSKVLEDLKRRIDNRGKYPAPVELDTAIRRYEELKEQLQSHAEAISKQWKETGRTIHEILCASVRFQQSVTKPAESLLPTNFDTSQLTPYFIDKVRDTVTSFVSVYQKVAAQLKEDGTIQSHPWYGVNNTRLQHFDTTRVTGALQSWQESLVELEDALQAINSHLGTPGYTTVAEAEGLSRDIRSLPELCGDEFLESVSKLKGNDLILAEEYLSEYEEILLVYEQLGRILKSDYLQDLEKLDESKPLTAELVRIT